MINTYLKFEAKIPNGSKLFIHKELFKFFKFKGQFDLDGQGQGHQFSNMSEIFRFLTNSSSVNAKFQMGQFKSSKQPLSKFVFQFDLEGQGQHHNFFRIVQDL